MDISKRVADYLKQMTVDEKIDQMIYKEIGSLQKDKKNKKADHVYGFYHSVYSLSTEEIRELKDFALANSRLQIPVVITGESLHGIMHKEGTIFPQNVALGAAFNKDLMERIADVIGEEANTFGIDQVFAPNVDLARDPRWGRTEECYSEDPYLVSEYAKAYVRGVQKHDVATTLKHFVAYCVPEGGLNEAPAHVGERELREYFLPPYEVGIQENVMAIMPGYNEIDGIPMHACKEWLNDWLREEKGFDGVIISDCDGIERMHSIHKCAETPLEAGRFALAAGVDIDGTSVFGYGDAFRQSVKTGEIDMAQIDEAVGRILTLKFKLGLMDNAVSGKKAKNIPVHTQYARDLALQAAEESIVLLKNDKKILPFQNKIKKVSVIGCCANDLQFGDYTAYHNLKDEYMTPKEAFETYFGKENILFMPGCTINSCSDEQLKQAQETAKKTDVAVVLLGDNSKCFGGIGWGDAEGDGTITCGENYDVSELTLPPAQIRLLEGVIATGVPVVLVFITGRVYSLEGKLQPDAILQMFYNGERGAEALVNIVTGKVNPSGRLPLSIPKSACHIPCFYNHKPSARGASDLKKGSMETPGHCYVFSSPEPLYPFGYGLSYGKMVYENMKAEVTDDCVKVHIILKNDSDYLTKEPLLLFDSVEYCEVTQPVRRLCEFEKITFAPGEQKEVILYLPLERFWYIDRKMNKSILKGKHTLALQNLSCNIVI